MCDKADVTNKILGNLPNRIRSPGNPGFSDCLSGIEKRFATHQQIDGRGIGKHSEFADAKQNSSGKKQGVVHFFQYSPNEPPKRHHWQTGVEASAHYDWLQVLKPSIQRMRKPKSAKMWRIRHPHNFVCIVLRIRCHPRKLPKRCHETGKADVTARRVPEERIRMGRVCDYCSTAKAVIFCRADSARLCLACDKQVRQLPAPISAKPGLTTGRSEWGKSPSTRRTGARVPVRRDVVNARSMPFDQSLPTGAFASARNGRFPHRRATPDAFWRQRLAKKPTPPLRSFSHPLSVSALLSGAHGESGGAETRPLMVV